MTPSQAKSPSPPDAIGDQLRSGGPSRPLSLLWDGAENHGDSLNVMSARGVRRLGILLLVAAGFGIGDSVLKGNGGGIRSALGNTSAPWLLLPFAGGAVVGRGRMLLGAAVGLFLSLAALASFYAANSYVLQLGPHPWIVDLRLTFDGGKKFFVLALLSGPVLGGLGGWWARTKSIVVPMGIAILFVLEPIIAMATRSSGSAVVWAGEVMVGIVAVLLLVRFAPRDFDRA